MSKKTKTAAKNVANGIAWIVGLIVSLAIGSGLITKVLTISFVPEIITIIAGWLVIIGAIVGVVAKLMHVLM